MFTNKDEWLITGWSPDIIHLHGDKTEAIAGCLPISPVCERCSLDSSPTLTTHTPCTCLQTPGVAAGIVTFPLIPFRLLPLSYLPEYVDDKDAGGWRSRAKSCCHWFESWGKHRHSYLLPLPPPLLVRIRV